jgi:phosphoglycolate phosphatase-like HAD superfamily hydrolase
MSCYDFVNIIFFFFLRHELLPLAVNQYCEYLGVKLSEIDPHDVIFVGDNPHDIDVAHDSGVPIISVNTHNMDEKLFKGIFFLFDFS